jgi:hypothetical protein
VLLAFVRRSTWLRDRRRCRRLITDRLVERVRTDGHHCASVIQFLDFGRTAEKGRIFAIATNRHRCDLLRNIGSTDLGEPRGGLMASKCAGHGSTVSYASNPPLTASVQRLIQAFYAFVGGPEARAPRSGTNPRGFAEREKKGGVRFGRSRKLAPQ